MNRYCDGTLNTPKTRPSSVTPDLESVPYGPSHGTEPLGQGGNSDNNNTGRVNVNHQFDKEALLVSELLNNNLSDVVVRRDQDKQG